jgi:hypothetical protein
MLYVGNFGILDVRRTYDFLLQRDSEKRKRMAQSDSGPKNPSVQVHGTDATSTRARLVRVAFDKDGNVKANKQ